MKILLISSKPVVWGNKLLSQILLIALLYSVSNVHFNWQTLQCYELISNINGFQLIKALNLLSIYIYMPFSELLNAPLLTKYSIEIKQAFSALNISECLVLGK